MKTLLKVFLQFGVIYHQIYRLQCDNQTIEDKTSSDSDKETSMITHLNVSKTAISTPQTCETGWYQCKNGVCINESLICDGKHDCQFGDDEDECIFADEYNITFCAKTNARCTCKNRFSLTLNCTDTGLVSLPKYINKRLISKIFIKGNKIPKLTSSGIFNATKELLSLSLTNNEIESIENDAFEGFGVSYFGKAISVGLYLSDNNISKLTTGMFKSLRLAFDLVLNRNQISVIENDTFTDLIIESYLDLSDNKLTKLTRAMFKGLLHVRDLDLQNNHISTIEQDTFRGISNLYWLNIDGNEITTLAPGMFKGLNFLIKLSLGHNKIRTIENNTFDEPMFIFMTLDLHGNKLTHLTQEIFSSPSYSGIHSLNLRDNEIDTIECDAFRLLTNLHVLDLGHNKLTKLPACVFENNIWLNELLLSENDISHIQPSTFDNLTALEILNLSSNPLHTVEKSLFDHNLMLLDNLLVDDLNICCQTKRRFCNKTFSKSYFCEDHRIVYICVGILLVVLIIGVILVLKIYSSRRTNQYKAQRNESLL